MIPITHFAYVAFFLLALGLGGAIWRRDVLGAVVGVPLMLAGAGLLGMAYARYWANHDGQLLGFVALAAALSTVAVGLSMRRRALAHGEEGEPG